MTEVERFVDVVFPGAVRENENVALYVDGTVDTPLKLPVENDPYDRGAVAV